jgi:hypothetical protein
MGAASLRNPFARTGIDSDISRPVAVERPTSSGTFLPDPAAPPPLQTLAFAAHERSQLATNDLDLSQGLPAKFDLGL